MITAPTGLFAATQANKWRSVLLIIGFIVLIEATTYGAVFVTFWIEIFQEMLRDPASASFHASALERTQLIFAQTWWQPFALTVGWLLFVVAFHRRILLWGQGGRLADRARERQLLSDVEQLAIQTGLEMPDVYILEIAEKNAFSIGLWRNKAAMVVTRGLLDALSRNEVRAVLAHEMAHIRSGDSQLEIIANVFANVVRLASGAATFGRLFVLLFPLILMAIVIAPGRIVLVLVSLGLLAAFFHVTGALAKLALSKTRDELADIHAIEMTHDPEALASALEKLRTACALPMNPVFDTMLFVRPPRAFGNAGDAVTERIARLGRVTGMAASG